jgi:hypothetical protein
MNLFAGCDLDAMVTLCLQTGHNLHLLNSKLAHDDSRQRGGFGGGHISETRSSLCAPL